MGGGFDFLSRQPTVKDPLFSVWAAKTRTLAVGSHNSATGHAAVFISKGEQLNKILNLRGLSMFSYLLLLGFNDPFFTGTKTCHSDP